MADYIIEENVEKVQETADEKVAGLSAETKENVIIPPQTLFVGEYTVFMLSVCNTLVCVHIISLTNNWNLTKITQKHH